MPFSTVGKNQMLDALVPNRLSLHSGSPGATGEDNEIELGDGNYARQACVFNAASSGARVLNADVEFEGPAEGAVTHIGVWNFDSPTYTFLGSKAITGDQAFSAAGEFTISASGPTRLILSDPA